MEGWRDAEDDRQKFILGDEGCVVFMVLNR